MFSKEISIAPCPPGELSGRFNETKKIIEILCNAKDSGQVIMVSGGRGSGKSSLLNWAEYEIQSRPGGFECPAIKKEFLETAGMVFTTYRELITDLKGHEKFGWFKKSIDNSKVRKSIDVALRSFEDASSLAGPYKTFIYAGVAASRGFLPSESIDYTSLLPKLLHTLSNLSDELIRNDRFLAVLLDDVQWSSELDFKLIKDLIRKLPRAIVLVIAFDLKPENKDRYAELQRELDPCGHTEIRLSGMTHKEIKDFASRRYNLSISDQAAEHLSRKIGYPLCLVRCFNRCLYLLQKDRLPPTRENFLRILPDAVEEVVRSARPIYSELNEEWRVGISILCVLQPPLTLPLISCMLGEDAKIIRSKIDECVIFRRLGKGLYDFADPSLREFCREELLEDKEKIELHSKAADCIETLGSSFPDTHKGLAPLFLAEHLFLSQNYEKALELNLQLGARFYRLFDYNLSLKLTDRAKLCAQRTNDKNKLVETLHQEGIILESMSKFDEAIEAYKQSLEIEEEIEDYASEASTLHQIGKVHEYVGSVEEALKYYDASLKIAREIDYEAIEKVNLEAIESLRQKT